MKTSITLAHTAVLAVLLSGCSSEPASTDPAQATTQPAAGTGTGPNRNVAARIVDSQVELQKPKVIKLGSGLNTEAKPQGLFGVGPDVMMTMLQSQVRLQRELNGGRNPTFAEFSQTVKQANIKLKVMPAWQMIGYDETTGELSLLEDKAEKIRQYKAEGVPLEEDDKKYDTPETDN